MQETSIEWVENKALKGFNAVRGQQTVGTIIPFANGRWIILGGKVCESLEEAKSLLVADYQALRANPVAPGSTPMMESTKGMRWNRALGRMETQTYDQRQAFSKQSRQLAGGVK